MIAILRAARFVGMSLLCHLCLSLALQPSSAYADSQWDTTATRGKTRVVDFETTEGTWMSVDISPDGRWIVFDLLAHIYRVASEGGVAESLTQESEAAVNFHPRFSPDGSMIAFISDRTGQNALWVMNTDGTEPRLIFGDNVSRLSDPKWTRDGKAIITVRSFPTYSMERQSVRLWQFPLDGTAPYELVGTASGTQAYWPSPDPDGRNLYYQFTTFAEPMDGLQRMQHIRHLDTVTGRSYAVTAPTGPRKYWGVGSVSLAPEVSPDGRWLTFARRIPAGTTAYRGHKYNRRTALWIRDLASGAERILMDPITMDMADAHGTKNLRVLPGYGWSSDSKSLVLSQGGKLKRVWLNDGRVDTIPFKARVTRTLSKMAQSTLDITDRPMQVRALSWPSLTPDGTTAVIEALGYLWRIDLGSGNVQRLTAGEDQGFEFMPQLSPDGKWVAFTSWHDERGGQLWKVPVSGGTPVVLTHKAAEYQFPVWSPDSASIVVVRDTGVDIRGRAGGQQRRFERLLVSAEGGSEEIIESLESPQKTTFGPGGLLYTLRPVGPGRNETQTLLSQGLPLSENFIILEAQSTDKSTPREVMRFSNAEEAAISPGGKWVAFRENDEIYSAPIATGQSVYASPLNWQGSPHNPQIHRDNVGANAKLVSENGGHHLWWAGPDTLVYINGKYLNVANLAEGTLTAHEIRIPSPPSRPKGTLALINARLITLSGQGVIERGSLVIRENRIACVGTCATGSADRVLDFEGKSIVPGFVDVHAHHLTSGEIIEQHRSTSASYLAYGVTTVLDPYDFGDSAFRIAELIEAGRMVGPRTFSTGRAFHPISPATGIKDFDEARRQVERLALAGAVSIKNFLQPRRDQRQMLSIAGGQAGMAVTNEGADLYYDLGCVVDGSTGFEHSLMYLPTYDDVAQFFGRSGAVYSPTIVVGGAGIWASDYYQSIGDLWNEPKQQRFTPWRRLLRSLNRTQTDFGEYSFPLFAETVADIKRAGGRIALGGHGEQPGLDTHWEIFSYGTALEPIEALAVASQGGAFLLGLQDDLGSLEVGRLADLVILDSNPLNDIRNTLDITHVMKGGQLFVGDTLDQIWPDEQPYGVPPWYDEAVFRAPELQQAR